MVNDVKKYMNVGMHTHAQSEKDNEWGTNIYLKICKTKLIYEKCI